MATVNGESAPLRVDFVQAEALGVCVPCAQMMLSYDVQHKLETVAQT